MGKVKYKCIIPNQKPEWLLRLQKWVALQCEDFNLQPTVSDYKFLEDVINEGIRRVKSYTRSVLITELRTDEGKTVVFIKRNGRMIQTYYIE